MTQFKVTQKEKRVLHITRTFYVEAADKEAAKEKIEDKTIQAASYTERIVSRETKGVAAERVSHNNHP